MNKILKAWTVTLKCRSVISWPSINIVFLPAPLVALSYFLLFCVCHGQKRKKSTVGAVPNFSWLPTWFVTGHLFLTLLPQLHLTVVHFFSHNVVPVGNIVHSRELLVNDRKWPDWCRHKDNHHLFRSISVESLKLVDSRHTQREKEKRPIENQRCIWFHFFLLWLFSRFICKSPDGRRKKRENTLVYYLWLLSRSGSKVCRQRRSDRYPHKSR